MIEVKNLYFSYDWKKEVLKNINFSIKDSEIIAILGPNGSGKTTLLKCINFILKPQRGNVYLNGGNIYKMGRKEIAKNISYVPQEHKDFYPYKVLDFILFGRTPHIGTFSTPNRQDIMKCLEIIKLLKIEHLSDRIYNQLSGGEKRLCLIARALATEAKILLLDEPTAHLDIKNEIEVLSCIKNLSRQKNLTIVMTLHNPSLALQIADRVVVLKDGRIIDDGPVEKIITEKNIEEIYSCKVSLFKTDKGSFIFSRIM